VISVIIPTRNRADMLGATMTSFLKQGKLPADYEVIIVDNGSTDNTSDVIKSFERKNSRIKSFSAVEPGLHTGRHVGLKNANFENLVFIDDDIEVGKFWLSSIVAAFEKPDVKMVAGDVLPKFMTEPPDWIFDLWHNRLTSGNRMLWPLSIIEFLDKAEAIDPAFVFGCNFPVRKSLVLEAGGFNPDALPKDMMRFRGDGETKIARYCRAKKYKCRFSAGASIWHKVPKGRMTKDYFYNRGFSEGISKSFSELRYGETLRSKFRRIGHPILEKLYSRHLGTEAAEIVRALHVGERLGRKYHRTAYYGDKEVQEWVRKEDFLTKTTQNV